jgi:cobaltochelatase CobT
MLATVGEQLLPLVVYLAFLILIALTWRSLRRRGTRSRSVPDGPVDEPYRIFTREHDLELRAAEAVATLETASPDFSKGWLESDDGVARRWAERAESLLGEQQGYFDELSAPLLDVAANGGRFTDTVVSILLDQSGSMKGEPIVFAAVTAALSARLLQRLGSSCEVLGFSTAGWHGGEAYRQWKDTGRPKRPGRLCALRHVIYKTAEDLDLDAASLRAMVHPDLLRENVDGEAIEWARRRLLGHAEANKILIVISDGAPVDDATLLHNGPSYLYRHLTKVLEENGDEIQIGAIGINYRVDAWYPVSETVQSAQEIPGAAVRLLEKLIRGDGRERPSWPE